MYFKQLVYLHKNPQSSHHQISRRNRRESRLGLSSVAAWACNSENYKLYTTRTENTRVNSPRMTTGCAPRSSFLESSTREKPLRLAATNFRWKLHARNREFITRV